jgi:hypothetical protein
MKSGATGCNSCSQEKNKSSHVDPTKWKPLLLIIPLRLGLTDINAVYTFNIFQVYKYFSIYMWHCLLKFEQFS